MLSASEPTTSTLVADVEHTRRHEVRIVAPLGLGAQPLHLTTLPQPENGIHEGVRRDARAQAQIVAFLRSGGQVLDTCSGACGPP